MEKKTKVLFLSTGNSTRSQMAEGFLRSMAGDRFIAVSAGTKPIEVNPLTVEVMKDAGVDISTQKPKNVTESLKEHFGYVITVCDMAKERSPIFPGTPHLIHWSILDPSLSEGAESERTKAYVRARDQIKEKVLEFVNQTLSEEMNRAAMAKSAAATKG